MKKKYSLLSNYQYAYGHLWKYDKKLVGLIILHIVIEAIKPLSAAILPATIVGVLESKPTFGELTFICLFVFSLVGMVHALSIYLKSIESAAFINIRCNLFWPIYLEKTMTVDYALYEKSDFQAEASKAGNALSSNHWGIEGFYHHNTALFIGILGLLISCLIMTNVHPLMVVLLIGLSFIQYLFYVIARNYREKHRQEQSKRERHQNYLFSQSYDVMSGKDIRLYQLQDWIIGIFQKYHDAYIKQDFKTKSFYFLYDFVGLLLQVLRDGTCYGYLLYLLTKGMNVSEFILYLGIVSGVGHWVTIISQEIAQVTSCSIDINYYRAYEDLDNSYIHKDGKELVLKESETFDIVFDDVCFVYPNTNRVVLDHVSFHISAGQKVALVGINGAGKTTLVKMLCGFYKPTSGRILINGIDLTTLDIEKYFDQISVLFQDAVTFSFTIAQNITGQIDEDIDREKLKDALIQSDFYAKVQTLKNKEDTFIGKDIDEGGVQLSGGQIQKLYLARAIYKKAPMLILDEPTAALDAIAESEMYEKYAELVKNKTSIFISHRLSSTRFCDRIFYLENGKIIEEGTHSQLMKLNGSYANMFSVQSQYYKEGGIIDEN